MSGRDPLIVVDIVVPEDGAGAAAGHADDLPVCGTGAPVGSAVGAACAKCGGRLVQRADDNQAVVLERLKVYHRQSEPLVEYYRVRPTFRSIDGAQPPDRGGGGSGGGDRGGRQRRGAVEREGDRLPLGSGARADARSRPAGRRSADRARRPRRARSDDGGPRRAGGEADPEGGGDAGVQGVSRLPGDDLRVGQRRGDPRDPVGHAGC